MADEPNTPAPDQPEPDAPEQPAEPANADPWADPGAARREIEKLRTEAAKYRTRNKELEPLATAAKEAEEAQKTEAERLSGQLTDAQKRAEQAQQRAVRAEVKALAANSFADPDDAHAFLDLAAYVDSDGDVDGAAIERDLAGLLERKPHLGKPDPGPRRPAPDRTQGSSGNGARTPTDPATLFANFMNQGSQRGR
ncbi:phage scaffolding protein [Streptomyces sp. NPDC054784]